MYRTVAAPYSDLVCHKVSANIAAGLPPPEFPQHDGAALAENRMFSKKSE